MPLSSHLLHCSHLETIEPSAVVAVRQTAAAAAAAVVVVAVVVVAVVVVDVVWKSHLSLLQSSLGIV